MKNSVICPLGGTSFGTSYTLHGVSGKPTCQKDSVNHVLPTDTTG